MLLSKVFSCRIPRSAQLLKITAPSWEISRFVATEKRYVARKKRPIMVAPRKRKPLPETTQPADVPSEIKQKQPDIPPYVTIDSNNSKFVRLMTAVKTRKQRYANQMFMLEGKRLIKEALTADVEPLMIVFNRTHLIKDLTFDRRYIQPEDTILHHLSYRHIKVWSDLKNSPGIFGLFRMPNLERNAPTIDPLPVTLVCDNVRDPGNLGSILRVAAAIPVEKVVLLSGCTDLWDTKVTRGSCGAMFHLKILVNASWEDVEDNCPGNVILADHETNVTDELLDEIDNAIEAEYYEEDPEHIFADSDNEEVEDDRKEKLRTIYKLPSKPYYGINYSNDRNYVIVIGGETHGLSEDSFKFANSRNGVRVNVPLAPSVSSLNSATALGIISFEVKRQLENHDQC